MADTVSLLSNVDDLMECTGKITQFIFVERVCSFVLGDILVV